MQTSVSTIIFGFINILIGIFFIFLFIRVASFLSNYKKDIKNIELKLNELSIKLDKKSKTGNS